MAIRPNLQSHYPFMQAYTANGAVRIKKKSRTGATNICDTSAVPCLYSIQKLMVVMMHLMVLETQTSVLKSLTFIVIAIIVTKNRNGTSTSHFDLKCWHTTAAEQLAYTNAGKLAAGCTVPCQKLRKQKQQNTKESFFWFGR